MKKQTIRTFLLIGWLIGVFTVSAFAQKNKPVIFAVINDGKTIEPIAHIDNKKLTETVGGDAEAARVSAFTGKYYRAKSKYKLIFAGRNAGVVTVEKANPKSDCAANLAEVSVRSTGAKLKGFVMGLATDFRTKQTASGIRRLPTAGERLEFEKLVRSELSKNEISDEQTKNLKYHNLTAIDVDDTGIVELVGTFWVDLSAKERGLIFLIVDKELNGTYTVTHSDVRKIAESEVMNNEIKTVDEGIYHELLLDYFDFDGDGVSEIFTMIRSFEGNSFNVYQRANDKWTKVFERYNYHCGF